MLLTNHSAEWVLEVKHRQEIGEKAVVGFLKDAQWWGIPGCLRGADPSYQFGLYCKPNIGPDFTRKVTQTRTEVPLLLILFQLDNREGNDS